jgi:hypothetical protein
MIGRIKRFRPKTRVFSRTTQSKGGKKKTSQGQCLRFWTSANKQQGYIHNLDGL